MVPTAEQPSVSIVPDGEGELTDKIAPAFLSPFFVGGKNQLIIIPLICLSAKPK
jgi:hypothetical protein